MSEEDKDILKVCVPVLFGIGILLMCQVYGIGFDSVLPILLVLSAGHCLIRGFGSPPKPFQAGLAWRRSQLLSGGGMALSAMLLEWGRGIPGSMKWVLVGLSLAACVSGRVWLRRARLRVA